MDDVLFINHKNTNCGIYQYGKRVFDIISNSKKINFIYLQIDNKNDYFLSVDYYKPKAIIYNYHYRITNWLNKNNMSLYPNIKHYKLSHEDSDKLLFNYFINDYHNKGYNYFQTSRPIFENLEFDYKYNEIPIIGSFGFGFEHKGFEKLCELVNSQFDDAIIRLHITFPFFNDKEGKISKSIVQKCKNKIDKKGIKLEINHNFLTDYEILKFLSENTINVFLYDYQYGRGFSSVLDYAVSVNRPIAISKSYMFRHLSDIEHLICTNNKSLKDIIQNGPEILNRYRIKWSNQNLIKEYETILENKILYNKILDDEQRFYYKNSIDEISKLCPDTIKRKIKEANVQQAFVFQTVKELCNLNDRILSVGSYEDTASESLVKLGYNITEIDPIFNYDLHNYFISNSEKRFDTIISTSVIEHVKDDEIFLNEICQLLEYGGYGILTCDFNNDYKIDDKKPKEDYRLYTINDFLIRFDKILKHNNCKLLGDYNWNGQPDFTYNDCKYSFATFVFVKNINNNTQTNDKLIPNEFEEILKKLIDNDKILLNNVGINVNYNKNINALIIKCLNKISIEMKLYDLNNSTIILSNSFDFTNKNSFVINLSDFNINSYKIKFYYYNKLILEKNINIDQ